MKIVIIGWTWVFWQFWKTYFEKKWLEVIISSRTTEIKPKDAVKQGNIIIFCLSIRNTKNVIKEIIPYISKNKLVMDFTGIKSQSIKELKKYNLWEVVWTHPMFWPKILSIKNQNIAFDPIKSWKKWQKIYDMWKKDWANLIQIDSKKHDEIVSIVQSTVHFMNLFLGHILKERWINIQEVVDIWTPNSRMQMLVLARFLNQNASLYTDMQFYNDYYKKEILPQLGLTMNTLKKMIKNNDIEKFEKEYNDIKEYIWQDFLDKSLSISQIVDKEVKKMIKN